MLTLHCKSIKQKLNSVRIPAVKLQCDFSVCETDETDGNKLVYSLPCCAELFGGCCTDPEDHHLQPSLRVLSHRTHLTRNKTSFTISKNTLNI